MWHSLIFIILAESPYSALDVASSDILAVKKLEPQHSAAALTKPKFFFVVLLYAAEPKKSMGVHQAVC